MQGTRIRLLVGGILLAAASLTVQAETLQPDPAWQQGKLDNGFSWQLLTTPQRPSDRVEIRLMVNTGSLVESAQQAGYSHLLPRLALVHNAALDPAQQRSLWQQSMDPQHPMPPAITSYDYTLYNLSLPNNRPELVKEALTWLAATAGKMTINEEVVNTANNADDPIATWPGNPQDTWWRYRLKGSSMLAHDPASPVKVPVDLAALNAFYKQWYTPDAMTLFVVGNVDSRSLSEQINKVFSPLEGKREQPSAMPTLSPLLPQPINLANSTLSQDRLSLVWDTPWQPIRESQNLLRYWQSDLAREALFWHVQKVLSDNKTQGMQVGFDCRVLYQRAQCAINLDADNASLNSNLTLIAKEMVNIRDKGLSQQEFDALIGQKNSELNKLFATYARTDTDVLMSQRLRSQQNAVVDIAPEQYQKLRQQFLSGLTLDMLNQELRQQLTQDMTMVLMQPPGEPETNVKALQESWQKIMTPEPAPAAASDAAAAPSGDSTTPPQ
ncbi:pitrilysin family protein [Erwinia aphidicola]|jgi:predicted Zn-dependent peptidase|uniref:Pitrilysin family protein n=1 Tax=Erwinia aphidicola TaxID=68334 RepID=A0ABU8DFZ5_ERWAP|nr:MULTISPECIES: pitrilysin family protein [Erwinia]KMV68239.1 peptidase [bacteria symbiont BFo1 of Frankliniella occidentalis]PIJ58561.1 peptidase M16 [Erwinia sp. OLMDLW33]KYP82995.1 peptidase [bacteria symbiont BFo1 of Frankliniella occidentalis]KYP87794.1 peptidase [bacteria symbiont BFo1 of Frankliniella occidentalis]MBD1377682.1 insulinase family protein [Erwinia aphidicola]